MEKIAYLLPYLEKGGTETHVLELIKGFQDKYDITLIAPPGPRLSEFEKYNISYFPFTSLNSNIFQGLGDLRKQLKKIKEINPGLIHIHAAHEYLLFSKLFLKGTPVIFTGHGYHGNLNKFDYKMSSIFNNLWADEVITVSAAEEKLFLQAGIKGDKLNLIPNGISLPENYSAGNLPREIQLIKENSNIIGTVARLEKAKGLTHLIKAFKKINREDNHLLIIGSGNLEKELKKQVRKLGLQKQVTFTGYVNNVHDYLELIDLFILPSLQEPFGLVCAEAMAHKLPVIASAAGGIPEIIEDQVTGLLVPPGNSNSLAGAVKKLLDNKPLARKMGRAGYERYKDYFTIRTFLDRTEEVYLKYF